MHWNYNKVRALATFHTANMSAKAAAGPSAGRTQLVNPRLPYAVAAHPSGHHVAVALGDGSVAVYDLASKKLVQVLLYVFLSFEDREDREDRHTYP